MTPTTLKTCVRCELELDPADFYRDSKHPDGRAAICRHCLTQDRREAAQTDEDGALQTRLAAGGVVTVADAYRKGTQDGASAAVRVLKRQGRLRGTDDEAAAQARAQRIVAKVDQSLPHTPTKREGVNT